MNKLVIQFVVVLGIWLLTVTTCYSADSDTVVNSMLVDDWRHLESGATLNIGPNGEYSITSATGSVALSGNLRSAGWESVDWHPGSLVVSAILRITIEGKVWVVSGYYSYGEGDPPGLTLFASGVFPEALFGAFGLDHNSGSLWLAGTGP